MAATVPHQQPTPEHFFNAINAYGWPLRPPATLTLLQSLRAFRKAPASRELSSRRRRSALIALSLRTGEFRTEKRPLRGLHRWDAAQEE